MSPLADLFPGFASDRGQAVEHGHELAICRTVQRASKHFAALGNRLPSVSPLDSWAGKASPVDGGSWPVTADHRRPANDCIAPNNGRSSVIVKPSTTERVCRCRRPGELADV